MIIYIHDYIYIPIHSQSLKYVRLNSDLHHGFATATHQVVIADCGELPLKDWPKVEKPASDGDGGFHQWGICGIHPYMVNIFIWLMMVDDLYIIMVYTYRWVYYTHG